MVKRFFDAESVPVLMLCIVLLVIFLIPLKVMSYGFMPLDDALRHSAKAVSGKEWTDILILRDGFTIDSHPGYHCILRLIHRLTRWNQHDLLTFSVVSLFLIFCLTPLIFIDRWEAWLAALLAVSMTSFSFILRLFFGRPFIITMASVVVLCFTWQRFKRRDERFKAAAAMAVLTAFAVWTHGSWYLFLLPLISFALSGEWQALKVAGVAIGTGIAAAAIASTRPYDFLTQNIVHGFLSLGASVPAKMLAIEFRPCAGDYLVVLSVAAMLLWAVARGDWSFEKVRNPVFLLAVMGWTLGFFVARFWYDWGIPALLVWLTGEFSGAMKSSAGARRLLVAIFLAVALYGVIIADTDSRWSGQPAAQYLTKDAEEMAPWMPEPGGIVYSSDMRVFYLTFFKYPEAQWRYILGFEPGVMPPEDLRIFRAIQLSDDAPESFRPWIRKMRTEDRLIVPSLIGAAPSIPDLSWHYAGSGFWVGRLPKKTLVPLQ